MQWRDLTLLMPAVTALFCTGLVSWQTPYPTKPKPGYTAACVVERVVDGDTVVVSVKHTFHVRLSDCWAPESRTKDLAQKRLGLASKENLETLLPVGQGGTVFIPSGVDLSKTVTLSRYLGYVWRDGDDKSVNEYQVECGFATKTKNGKSED